VTGIVTEGQTFALDGIEIRPAVLSLQEIDAIKAEVSVDHETLRRTGIRNIEKKFGSIARVAENPSVLSSPSLRWVGSLGSSARSSLARHWKGTGLWPGTRIGPPR